MRLLHSATHPDVEITNGKSILKRLATRAICLDGQKILLLHTERYQDYSLPGGGIDSGEDILDGLVRELKEETGAQNIRDIKEFGIYEEYRPWYKAEQDIMHMTSYCYTCTVDTLLGETNYETYETNNGMKPVWIDISKAIAHNENTLRNSDKKGLSIERELFLLRLIKDELL